VNLHRRMALHGISFKNAVKIVAFNPCRGGPAFSSP
jgi:hypothetical protein